MRDGKLLPTIVHVFNSGISSLLYYEQHKHPKLHKAFAFFKDEKLCFVIEGKEYRFVLESSDKKE